MPDKSIIPITFSQKIMPNNKSKAQRTVENVLKLSDKITDQLVQNKIELDNTSLHNFIDLCEQYNFAQNELTDYELKANNIYSNQSMIPLYKILTSTKI
jgi:hypothetical protein